MIDAFRLRFEQEHERSERTPSGLLPLQPHRRTITFGAAMRKPVFLLLFLLAVARAGAQDLGGPGSLPIEINSTGQTNYENGLATARDNVAIHFGDTDIYSDFAQYDEAKRTIFLKGNVRIYRGISLYAGEQATYNIDTKAIDAQAMRSGTYPYLLSGRTVTSVSDEEYTVKNGSFTTDDAEHPDFHLNAQSVRIYQNDRVIFKNVTFYIGKVPVFWWPYLYQSLDRTFSYSIAPAYLSSWGPSLLGQITFPIGEKITSTVKLDYRSRRGVALGFDSEIRYGKNDKSLAKFTSYFLQDQNPDLNRTSLPRQGTPTSRFRLSLQNRTQITDDIDATADITKLSDAFLLQDFFPSEFRVNPKPDNVLALTKTSPWYTLTAYGRFALNTFFETTERLPEVALDIKRHGLFGGPIFYEGETTARRAATEFSGQLSLPGLRRLPARFLSSTDLPEHLLRVSLDRAAGRLSRDLLQRDAHARPEPFHDPAVAQPVQPGISAPQPGARRSRTSKMARSGVRSSTPGSRVRSRFRGNGTTCRPACSGSTGCATSFSRSRIFPGSLRLTSIPRPFSSSIASSPRPS